MIFKTVWNYVLSDLAANPAEDLTNAEMFLGPGDRLWSFLGGLDDASRLLYEATKITAHTGPPAAMRLEVQRALEQERQRNRNAALRSREAVWRARIKEQLRFYGPPRPARAGELTLLGAGEKAHVWRQDGMYGAVVGLSDIFCGGHGVAHPAPSGAPRCKACKSISTRRGMFTG